MTQTNRQTPTQSGAKAKPMKTRPISPAKLTAIIEESREEIQPVLDYLAKKPVKTRRITRTELLAALRATKEKDQPVLDYLKDK